MLSFNDRRALHAAQAVSTENLCRDFQAAVAAAAQAITATGEATNGLSAEFEAADVSEARHAAFRTFAVLSIATFRRFADEVARNNERLTKTH